MAPFWSKSNVSSGGYSDAIIDQLDFSRPPLTFGKFQPTKNSRSRGEAPDDPLDTSQPPASLGKFLPPRRIAAACHAEVAALTKATSMLEMNVIHDMVQFGEAMDALSDEENKVQEDEDDSGFFIDSSEPDDSALVLSTSPDSVLDVPLAAPPSHLGGGAGHCGGGGDGVGGMRRVMSQMSLTSTQRQSLMFDPDIHTISEEPESVNHVEEKTAKINSKEDMKGEDYSRQPSLTESSHSMDSTTLDNSSSRRRRSSRRSSSNGGGMPLRSSLKGSRNSLEALRSSIKSTDSNQSIGSLSTAAANNKQLDNSSHSMKRNVSFNTLEIRSYNVTLGDAPTSNGPAVSLAWEYDPAAEVHDLDTYENYRRGENPRRNRGEMLMPASHRQYLLMREAGFTRGELMLAMEEAKRVAKGRAKTVKRMNMGLQPVEEVLEKTRRKFGRLGKSSRKV